MAQKLERLELRIAIKGIVVQGNRNDGGIATGNAGPFGRADTIMSVDLC